MLGAILRKWNVLFTARRVRGESAEAGEQEGQMKRIQLVADPTQGASSPAHDSTDESQLVRERLERYTKMRGDNEITGAEMDKKEDLPCKKAFVGAPSAPRRGGAPGAHVLKSGTRSTRRETPRFARFW